MASYRFIALVIVAIVTLPAIVTAMEYVVGDDSGWTISYDYAAWAKDKVFHVGDTLVFKYTPPNHNVIKVNGTEFKDCTSSKVNAPLTSGNDVITLATPGKKWYICGKVGEKRHCADLGQKLAITVVADGPAPSPTAPANAASGMVSSPVVVAALVFMAMIIMV